MISNAAFRTARSLFLLSCCVMGVLGAAAGVTKHLETRRRAKLSLWVALLLEPEGFIVSMGKLKIRNNRVCLCKCVFLRYYFM